jgi:hypothetical protein
MKSLSLLPTVRREHHSSDAPPLCFIQFMGRGVATQQV